MNWLGMLHAIYVESHGPSQWIAWGMDRTRGIDVSGGLMLDRLGEFIGLICKVLLIGTAILVSCTVIFLF
ncbi:hypothetical protein LCGC14_1978880, partial [marine sediment metagenome]